MRLNVLHDVPTVQTMPVESRKTPLCSPPTASLMIVPAGNPVNGVTASGAFASPLGTWTVPSLMTSAVKYSPVATVTSPVTGG
jgi:hypothetical protein